MVGAETLSVAQAEPATLVCQELRFCASVPELVPRLGVGERARDGWRRGLVLASGLAMYCDRGLELASALAMVRPRPRVGECARIVAIASCPRACAEHGAERDRK